MTLARALGFGLLVTVAWADDLLDFRPKEREVRSIHFTYTKLFKSPTVTLMGGGSSKSILREESGECWIKGDRWRWEVSDLKGKMTKTLLCDGQRTVEFTAGSTTATAFAPRPFAWIQLYDFHPSTTRVCLYRPFHYAGDVVVNGKKCERVEAKVEREGFELVAHYARTLQHGLILTGGYEKISVDEDADTATRKVGTILLTICSLNGRIPGKMFVIQKSLALVQEVYHPRYDFPPSQELIEYLQNTKPPAYVRWLPMAYELLAKNGTPQALFSACRQKGIDHFDGLENLSWKGESRRMRELIRLAEEKGVEWYLQQRDSILARFVVYMKSAAELPKKRAILKHLLAERKELLETILRDLGEITEGNVDTLRREAEASLQEAKVAQAESGQDRSSVVEASAWFAFLTAGSPQSFKVAIEEAGLNPLGVGFRYSFLEEWVARGNLDWDVVKATTRRRAHETLPKFGRSWMEMRKVTVHPQWFTNADYRAFREEVIRIALANRELERRRPDLNFWGLHSYKRALWLGFWCEAANGRVRVSGLFSHVPAATEAGLAVGDVITHVDGTSISTVIGLIERLRGYVRGSRVRLTCQRAGHTITLTLTVP